MWLLANPVFKGLKINDLYLSWKGCMKDQRRIAKPVEKWVPPHQGTFKFNVDDASIGKPGSAGIGGVLRNHMGENSIMFNESVSIKDSNEAEILTIKRALIIWKDYGQGNLIIEEDSANAFKWALGLQRPPWRLINVVRKVRELAKGMEVSFTKVGRSANGVVDFFAKLGVDSLCAGVFFI